MARVGVIGVIGLTPVGAASVLRHLGTRSAWRDGMKRASGGVASASGASRASGGRRLPVGAECRPGGGVDFRVWAPKRTRVEVVLEGGPGAPQSRTMLAECDGYHCAVAPEARAGTRYRFRLDGGPTLFPDPASRLQPEGPHGPSEVVDPSVFTWSDAAWPGVELARQVLYEMHVGTFTREGTWAAAQAQLPALADLGVTLVEMMPVADFPGRFGWGYDGVDLFAPTRLYGSPDDLRRFVDAAHAAGLGVILDVVYNHLGPDGNFLSEFSDHYFTRARTTDWGPAVNYDGEGSAGVRDFVLANARYWTDEFHFDGLRLDATHAIFDDSRESILAAIGRVVRDAARPRRALVFAESETQVAALVRPVDRGGDGLDAVWNDDLHHTMSVALANPTRAYEADFGGTPQELLSVTRRGFLYQGQRYASWNKRRGTPALDVSPERFVAFLENHDQVANPARGQRLRQLGSAGRRRALTTLVLLGPATPLLFQGQEYAASTPFLYFADHTPELAAKVRAGREAFLTGMGPALPAEVPPSVPPDDPATFAQCKLDPAERERHAADYRLHRTLLALRRDDPVFGRSPPAPVDGAVLGPRALAVRYSGPTGDDRLIVVNLGAETSLSRVPEPLLAPPPGKRWDLLFASEDPAFGGTGAAPPEDPDGSWHLPAEAAVVLRAV
jgi:maltooligosyltrehalose trehalohydrolase